MRFYFGFSKRLKIKTIIEILGFLFVGALAFLGLVPHAFASTVGIGDGATTITADTYTYYTNFPGDSTQVNTSSFYINKNVQTYYTRLSLCTGSNCFNGNFAPTYQYLGVTRGSGLTSIFSHARFKYTPSSSQCPNDTTDLKSINYRFEIGYPDNYWFNQSYSYFNLTDNWATDLNGFKYKGLNVRMIAHATYNEEDYYFSTTCSNSNYIADGGNNFGGVLVTCNNVFNGNSTYPVDYYFIEIGNGVPFDNIYSSSNDNKYLISSITIAVPNSNSYQNRATFDYECSDLEPVINESLPSSDTTNPLNDIYINMLDDFDPNIYGIDTELMFLNLPTTLTDLVTMPVDLINVIVQNTTSSTTCSPYSLDFSSIVKKWGNPNGSYSVQLPCMRVVLGEKLGVVYTMVDSLLAFYVFYNMVMLFVRLINAIMSGEDLYTYFFRDSNDKNNYYSDKNKN